MSDTKHFYFRCFSPGANIFNTMLFLSESLILYSLWVFFYILLLFDALFFFSLPSLMCLTLAKSTAFSVPISGLLFTSHRPLFELVLSVPSMIFADFTYFKFLKALYPLKLGHLKNSRIIAQIKIVILLLKRSQK